MTEYCQHYQHEDQKIRAHCTLGEHTPNYDCKNPSNCPILRAHEKGKPPFKYAIKPRKPRGGE